jgi:hypothetical protein
MFPLTSSMIEQTQTTSIAGDHLAIGDLKAPNDIFGIDDTFNYVGQVKQLIFNYVIIVQDKE